MRAFLCKPDCPQWPKIKNSPKIHIVSEHGYLVRTLASRPGVPGSNPIAAPKPCEVYPSTSGLLTFKKSETVLWSIAKYYYYYN